MLRKIIMGLIPGIILGAILAFVTGSLLVDAEIGAMQHDGKGCSEPRSEDVFEGEYQEM